jgi:hypothetical protein
MKPSILPTAIAVAALAFAAGAAIPAHAQMKEQTVTVGGAPMYPSKNIIQNAMNSKDHTRAWSRRCKGPAPSPSSRRPMPPSESCRRARSIACSSRR